MKRCLGIVQAVIALLEGYDVMIAIYCPIVNKNAIMHKYWQNKVIAYLKDCFDFLIFSLVSV